MRRFLAMAVAGCVMLYAMCGGVASADSIVLQQGADGYTGTADSFVRTTGYGTENNSNYGGNTGLQVKRERYSGG